jgi:hypothetical protein
MDWKAWGPSWSYRLVVNDQSIPANWTKMDGPINVRPPEVVGDSLPQLLVEGPRTGPFPPDVTKWLTVDTNARGTEEDTRMPSISQAAPNLLVLPPPRPEQSKFMIVDVRTSDHSTIFTCCESVTQSREASRAMIPTEAAYVNGFAPAPAPLAIADRHAYGAFTAPS